MKQFIVLMAMIALGLFLYATIVGDGNSILTSLKALWRSNAMTGPYHATFPGGIFGAVFGAVFGGRL